MGRRDSASGQEPDDLSRPILQDFLLWHFFILTKREVIAIFIAFKRLSNEKLSLEKIITAEVKCNKGYCKMQALLNTEHLK